MSIKRCDKCGGRITFKNIDGRAVPIHIDGSCNQTTTDQGKLFEKNEEYKSFVTPNANCPECGADVFYYENSHGSKVFFDSLGPPWPVHPCTTDNNVEGASSPTNGELFNTPTEWYLFKISSIRLRAGQKYLLINGIIIDEYNNFQEQFKVRNKNGLKRKVEEGTVFIKWNGRRGLKKFELSVLDSGKQDFRISNIKSLKAKRSSKKNFDPAKRKEKRNKKRIVLGSVSQVSQTRKLSCPLCPKRFKSRHFLGVHLKQMHWDKRKNKFNNSRSLNNTISQNMSFSTWKKLVLRDLIN